MSGNWQRLALVEGLETGAHSAASLSLRAPARWDGCGCSAQAVPRCVLQWVGSWVRLATDRAGRLSGRLVRATSLSLPSALPEPAHGCPPSRTKPVAIAIHRPLHTICPARVLTLPFSTCNALDVHHPSCPFVQPLDSKPRPPLITTACSSASTLSTADLTRGISHPRAVPRPLAASTTPPLAFCQQ